MEKKTILTLLLGAFALGLNAQSDSARLSWLPDISGTVRAKAEYQINEQATRFQVRNARVALDGRIIKGIEYRAEIDFSDEGRMRMLDAYVGLRPLKGFRIRLGQMRVPYSIDAHRSPHLQYFANRSFIDNAVGDVRYLGLALIYSFCKLPLKLEGGLFNGS